MGAWAYFAKVSNLPCIEIWPYVRMRMQFASIWNYFRLEIRDLKISKILSRVNRHMFSRHQLINRSTLKTKKKILSNFTNDIYSRRVRKYQMFTQKTIKLIFWSTTRWRCKPRESLIQERLRKSFWSTQTFLIHNLVTLIETFEEGHYDLVSKENLKFWSGSKRLSQPIPWEVSKWRASHTLPYHMGHTITKYSLYNIGYIIKVNLVKKVRILKSKTEEWLFTPRAAGKSILLFASSHPFDLIHLQTLVK